MKRAAWTFVVLMASATPTGCRGGAGSSDGADSGPGGDAAPVSDGAAEGDADADVGSAPATDLGEFCAMGCDRELCVATDVPRCETGFCVWDGRFGYDAYCSQPCDEVPCPEGWDCLMSDDGVGRFCFARPAECGNGVVERGEVCDPGPDVGAPASGCAEDCRSRISGGRVSYLWDGYPVEQSGSSSSDDVEVSAREEDGVVTIQVFSYLYSLSLRMLSDELAGAFPRTVSGRVALGLESWCFANPGPDAFGDVIEVTLWEEGSRIAGSFDGRVTYHRCCGVCVDPEVTSHEITESHFDVYLASEADAP